MEYSEYLDSPLFWLRRATLAVQKAFGDEMSQHGLSAAQFEVLRHLWRRDGMEMRALQERLGVTSPTLTGVVDGMVERGMVERRLSPDDARVRLVFLTEAGRALEERFGGVVCKVEDRLLSGFSPAECVLLKDWLRRIAANVGLTGEGCD